MGLCLFLGSFFFLLRKNILFIFNDRKEFFSNLTLSQTCNVNSSGSDFFCSWFGQNNFSTILRIRIFFPKNNHSPAPFFSPQSYMIALKYIDFTCITKLQCIFSNYEMTVDAIKYFSVCCGFIVPI